MDYAGRLLRARNSLPQHHVEFLLITHLPNIRYLCGFTGSSAALLLGGRHAILFTDGRYRTQAAQETAGVRVRIGRKNLTHEAAEWILDSHRTSHTKLAVGIEAESISVASAGRISRVLKGRARLRPVSGLIERARIIKDADEIKHMRSAAELGASLFQVALARIRAGRPEIEVAAEMEHIARGRGADGMSFDTIIASGTRSALIHGRASQARIPGRGFVVCDFGVILAGYCSDRTRTVHVGRPSSEARRNYNAVLEAQKAAISIVRAGVSVAEIDTTARKMLRRCGLARYFTHSTGHGLGLEIHEAPRLAAGQTEVLKPGMVITIEPGIYIPGKMGIRIEDMVVVTDSGCEVLAPSDKELISI